MWKLPCLNKSIDSTGRATTAELDTSNNLDSPDLREMASSGQSGSEVPSCPQTPPSSSLPGSTATSTPDDLLPKCAQSPEFVGAARPGGWAHCARPYRRQGERRPSVGRDAASLRARSAQAAQSDPAPMLTEAQLPLALPTSNGLVANPTVYLTRETVAKLGIRLWVRDAYQGYLAWAREHKLKAASMARFGQAATNLGFDRRKSCDWFYPDRSLRCLKQG